ncbi:hypothetical protein ACFPTY_13125 [Halomonas beimenensis]|uniref:Zinc resistance-associated protein n=1 Tax=Halomonas beimenensis TaxID=475662 RepID=A0A291PAT4_9GAMM|nr:hypothetical protein [Halomonas beimenensis]ATJ83969.1 hypothetical protein BEI_2982 [Halomonas beimenensis]
MTPILSRKRLVTLLLAGLATPLSLVAGASPSDGPERGPQVAPHLQALYDRAGLDAETREALHEARAEHRRTLRELQAEHRQRLAEILDDDQRAALEQARRELHEQRRAELREARQARLDALYDEWDLDTATREALGDAQADFREQARALRERRFDDREARREAWRTLRDDFRDTLAEHLDERQLDQLHEALRPPRRAPGRHHRGTPAQAPDAG